MTDFSRYGPAVEAKVIELTNKGTCTFLDLAQAQEHLANATEEGCSAKLLLLLLLSLLLSISFT